MSTDISAYVLKQGESNFRSSDRPAWDLYSTCIHCGLCLSHCPTYRLLGTEMDSPRGRIYQVLQVDSGRLPIGESFVTHIDRCLDCRACESVCPSGVEYGRIVERARAEIATSYRRPFLERMLRRFGYATIRDWRRLFAAAHFLRFLQRTGVHGFVLRSGLLRLFGLQHIAALAPTIEWPFFHDEYGKSFPATGERRGRVALLGGCIASVAFAELNRATIRLLQANGVEVYVPGLQKCCGALHAHAGLREDARAMARQNVDVFLSADCDAIITNAAGCGSTLKEYHDLLAADPEYAERAAVFAAKVRDVNEYLAQIGLRAPVRKLQSRVVYQDACHLLHGQKIKSAPRELLRSIGAEVVELPHPDQCCGSAGTYNVAQNELSMQVLAAKMADIESVTADAVATANVGCMLQLRYGMAQRGLNLPVKHVVELLDEAYRA